MNVYLKDTNNKLDLGMKPLNGHGKVEASSHLYGSDDIVSTDDAQSDRKIFTVESSGGPKEEAFYFDNDRFDFSPIVVDAPVIVNQNELKAYAARLLEIIWKKDAKKLLVEMEPKIRDYATAFSSPEVMLRNSLVEQLTGLFSHEQLKRPSIEAIVLVPYCDGRVWALKMKPDLPLIYVSDDGSIMSLEIYVGTVDG